MEVPRYRRDRQQPNNVARIWLLRGTAKHVCLLVVAAMPQRRFVPRLRFFWQQSFDFVVAPPARFKLEHKARRNVMRASSAF
jgi:hypothetical protein